ncbi:DUF1761 domain-containing protein [Patescibacteria group bacterium]|nr:DUF1761 domain-containing protein [Patescibacteria group bacterium]
MVTGDVQWLAVIVAAIIGMALGAFWYSKNGFGKAWMKEMGLSEEKLKTSQQKMGKMYALAFVASLVSAFVLANVVRLAGATTVGAGIAVGFWVWLGFAVPIMLGSILWENKSQKLFNINAGYQLVSWLIMAAVLAIWA